MPAQTSEWLGTKEAARAVGLTGVTLRRLIDGGDLPAFRFGRVIRVRRADVDAYIENSRIKISSGVRRESVG